jgi:cytochrome b
MPTTQVPTVQRIWDLPTRIFHWLLAICVIGAIISANIGGNAMAWHLRFGYASLALLLFRVIWGFVGPRYARFASFPPNPRAAWLYLRGRASHRPGHSPLAAWSVYAMLLAVAIQTLTGLFANDGIMWDGPLRNWVSEATSNSLTGWHLRNRIVLIALIVLHLAAIVWYRVARDRRLTHAMITGDAPLPEAGPHKSAAPGSAGASQAQSTFFTQTAELARPETPSARDDFLVRLSGLALAILCSLAVWALVR